MQVPLQITLHALPHSDALEARINERAAKLERLLPRMTRCHVTVEQTSKHPAQGRQLVVRVQVRGPDREEIVASRQHDEDAMVALRDAFDAIERQIVEAQHASRVRRHRGDAILP